MEGTVSELTRYIVPGVGNVAEKALVSLSRGTEGRRFPFWERLTIGRLDAAATPVPGFLYVDDPAVSSNHCVVMQDPSGHCFVRDLSLNGTRIDHRRLVPGADTEMKIDQVLSVGEEHEFALRGEVAVPRASGPRGTRPMTAPVEVTVLVGDISHYTTLVRSTPPELLQASVTAVIQELASLVGECEGTVKEYPGDAIVAYWESSPSSNCAVRACRAVFALDAVVPRLAWDPSIWKLPPEILRMDWALATGKVMIGRIGGAHPVGLSVVGEPIVKAFRLEKIADESTGPMIACNRTRLLAQGTVDFRELGEFSLEGFEKAEDVFAVLGAR
jgi:class 3 adenylate cyclase